MAIAPADLQWGNLLGKGAFSEVYHVRNLKSGRCFAVKMMDKRKAMQIPGMKRALVNERNILIALDHPNVVRLFFTYQDELACYFALELIEGGELTTQLARQGIFSLESAQFYTAEIVIILEYLRLKRIVHRDLKPENLLLTLEGHLKLIDFGTSLFVLDDGDGFLHE